MTQPTELGSGGSDSGNPGGGAIELIVAGTLQLDGTISANGGHYANHGGGAGGSIWIHAGTIAGGGTVQANGAQGGNDNGGGGGRISINYQWVGAGTVIQAQSMVIQPGALISADGLGYAAGQGPGAGMRAPYAGGGGHGGMGGAVGASGGAAYGSLTQPIELGSGGADGGNPGGGAIELIVAGTLQMDGTLSANGGHYANHGGGAGGSIWIQAGTITGSGTIQANGAQGGNDNGGGGGRISINYQTDAFAGTATAWGGAHGGNGVVGGAGTIYLKSATGSLGYVTLDNSGQVGAYTPADLMEGTNLVVTVTNGTQVVIAGGEIWGIIQLSVGANCGVWCYSTNNTGLVNGEWLGAGVVIQAQSILIQTGAVVSADGLGYASGEGPGAGVRDPYGGGGGHGGMGGTVGASGGATYGFLTQPTDLGSGGSDPGNPGGGAIELMVTGTLEVDGTISADAVHTANHGGGAGGSILIVASTVVGSGTIQANGGQGGNDNGGGGGRVAVYYSNALSLPTNNITVTGGAHGGNGEDGSPGTIYLTTQPFFTTPLTLSMFLGTNGQVGLVLRGPVGYVYGIDRSVSLLSPQ